jgi:hypothetical protein
MTGGLRKLRKAAHERSANAEDVKVQGWDRLYAGIRKGAEL